MLPHCLWHLFYDKLAWLYDIASACASGGRWRSWGRASINFLEHQRVLELGHGPGHLLHALSERGYRPVGIDRSAPMGKQAAWRMRRAGYRVPLVRCRAQALPFLPGSFDDVVATFPTDCIFDPATLREVARVTSPRARLVIVAGVRRKGPNPDPDFVRYLSGFTGSNGNGSNGHGSVFEQAGLQARIECQPVGEDTVMLVIAEKPARENTAPPPAPTPDRRTKASPVPGRVETWKPVEVGHHA